MKVEDFNYDLPQERIAQVPIEPRDHSQLMVVDAKAESVVHKHFYDLPQFLQPNDVLVVNETRVIPARLFGTKLGTQGKVEFLLLRPLTDKKWEVLVKPGKRCKAGTIVEFSPKLQAKVLSTTDVGGRVVEFICDQDFGELLEELGETPLPPYITEQLEDKERYQTVYAKAKGSVAAPTAGLHFTPRLLAEVKSLGVQVVSVVLHVGLGTFRPVKVAEVADHHMHAEYYSLEPDSAAVINDCRAQGGRVIAVGTTTVRVLETLAQENGSIAAGSGWTDIFIYPGYQFKLIDALITNFHLPKSSLLMLVSALIGYDVIKSAYQVALSNQYRFFSFGDAMLLVR